MLRFLTRTGRQNAKAANKLYDIVLAQSRNPVFYEYFGVPDTVDGRFEMIALHGGLLVDRLCQADTGKRGQKLAQAFFDSMFRNIDWSVREMGIGDLSVPRHMKRMMTAFKGRAFAYGESAKSGRGCLVHALKRNVYGTVESISQADIEALAAYVDACIYDIRQRNISELIEGQLKFPDAANFMSTQNHAKKIA